MLARDLISTDVPPLKIYDEGKKALDWMDEFKVSHLPVTDKTNYIGLISDAEVMDLISSSGTINKLRKNLSKPFIFDYQHAYEALKLFTLLKVSVIPVLDSKEHYMGVITQQKLLDYLAELTDAADPGSILVLELNQQDYSLSQIAQIAESNNARILSLFVSRRRDSTELEVTIKLNLRDASSVMQTLERYGYHIRASYTQGASADNLKERYDSLMYYLNI